MQAVNHRKEPAMSTVLVSTLLRRALLADAAASGLSGALLSFDAEPLSALFGLPAALLQAAGLFTLAYAVLVAWLGTRDALWRPAVWAVVVGNVLWALGSVELLLTRSPTPLGAAYVIAQAVVVAVLAEFQFMGLKRSSLALRTA
jgi:glucose uptake protein GlcU